MIYDNDNGLMEPLLPIYILELLLFINVSCIWYVSGCYKFQYMFYILKKFTIHVTLNFSCTMCNLTKVTPKL